MKNERHKLSVVLNTEGIRIQTGQANWGTSLLRYGYDGAVTTAGNAVPQMKMERVEYRRGLLTEWYQNGPEGLEQGFTLDKPPGERQGKPLTIALTMSGDLKAIVDAGGTSLSLMNNQQRQVLRYTGLTSHDAAGKKLRSWMEIHEAELRIEVEDAEAVYPVVIDPWTQLAELTVSDGTADEFFGNSVAVSGDGKSVAVGAFQDTIGSNVEQGAVYVYTKPLSGWTNATEVAKLTASDGKAGDLFGSSIAMSADGTQIVIGASHATIGNNSGQGALYVFVKPTKGWASTSNFTAKLTVANGHSNDSLGSAVSISGNTIVAGADGVRVGSNPYQGSAYLFSKPTAGWKTTSTYNAELTTSDGAALNLFGYSIGINNNTIVIGAPLATINGNTSQGATYIYVKPTSGWATTSAFNAKLSSSDGAQWDNFGNGVAISKDATLVVAGAPGALITGEGSAAGAAYLFVKPASGWSGQLNETGKLTADSQQYGNQDNQLGSSVAINSDNVVMAGAPCAVSTSSGCGPGAVFLYNKPVGGWANATESLVLQTGNPGGDFGISIASSGGVLTVGAFAAKVGSNSYQGVAYIF